MALSWRAKKNIDFLVPVTAAAVVALITFKKGKDAKFVAIVGLIVMVLGYVIVSQITKNFYLTGPAPTPTGRGCEDFDPRTVVDKIHSDINEIFGFRDIAAYDALLVLSDCEFIKANNYWNQTYWSDDKQTLNVAIQEQSGSTMSPGTFTHQQAQIAARCAKLGLS